QQNWIAIPKSSVTPLPEAITVYTDAGKRSRTAAATWQEKDQWCHHIIPAHKEDSLQTLELIVVVWVLVNFPKAVNIVTDSMYVAGVSSRIEDAFIKQVQNHRLYELLL
ncbi:POK19 protein, partial [Certhia brachydactyla]|nr:POK19 protein [Certhia brachydactyla]